MARNRLRLRARSSRTSRSSAMKRAAAIGRRPDGPSRGGSTATTISMARMPVPATTAVRAIDTTGGHSGGRRKRALRPGVVSSDLNRDTSGRLRSLVREAAVLSGGRFFCRGNGRTEPCRAGAPPEAPKICRLCPIHSIQRARIMIGDGHATKKVGADGR